MAATQALRDKVASIYATGPQALLDGPGISSLAPTRTVSTLSSPPPASPSASHVGRRTFASKPSSLLSAPSRMASA